MNRRLFVKNTGIFSMGLMAFSSSNLLAKNTTEENTVIDLMPITSVDKEIILQGKVVDALTSQPITGCKMTVKTKMNRLFKTTKDITTHTGEYIITTGFSTNRKISKTIEVVIEAPGYKTYTSSINLSTMGCHLHSHEWNYNRDFNPEHCPVNKTEDDKVFSSFNFRLIR